MTTENSDFGSVTELPGNLAHSRQLDIIRTRYSWASKFCKDKNVIEIACGSGLGLGLLSGAAKSVIGCDIDPAILKYCSDHYKNRNIRLLVSDACKLEINDNSQDVAICFEAIYYFQNIEKFISEVKRILRPGGIFICSFVNCEWHGFNPSPHSKQYFSINNMLQVLDKAVLEAEFFLCFEDKPDGFRQYFVSTLRRIAVSLHIIPTTMKGKEFFKKLFYGRLSPLPNELTNDHGKEHTLKPFLPGLTLANHKFIYFVARQK